MSGLTVDDALSDAIVLLCYDEGAAHIDRRERVAATLKELRAVLADEAFGESLRLPDRAWTETHCEAQMRLHALLAPREGAE